MTRAYRNNLIGITAYLLAVSLFVMGVWWTGFGSALDQLGRRATSDLALASDSLAAELKRFRELAVLTADRPEVSAALRDADDVEALRPVLQEIADKTGALDIRLVGLDGAQVAGVQAGVANSHAGAPYFERAMDGALGAANLMPSRVGPRRFIFAAPVFSAAGPVMGALMVSAGVEAVEDAWRGARPALFFTDAQGMIFVSNRSELVMRSRKAGDFIEYTARERSGYDLWTVDAGRYLPRRALHLTKDLPAIDMRGEILVDLAPARQLATLQAVVAAAVCLAFGAWLFSATQRRATLAQANARLESRVQDRTAQLSRANAELTREVAERRAAETQLKKAQADLVQAGKLSALGQLSAGISHELNQPLMAIQTFAENGVGFLDRDRPEVAAKNLRKISELSYRMARIIKNLRAFSRQESEPFTDVDVGRVVDVVLELLAPKIADAGVAVQWTSQQDVIVRAGEVRLQQVILNLATNAIDAMEASAPKILTLDVTREAGKVVVAVRDTGPGITEPEKIFDPFYSTKAVGAAEGMGLGLSISYGLVQSFGGAIRGRNDPDGGAVFTVELIPADARKVR
tara:strand:- start:4432 stop:6159 length:1728 start_codon:yes stop_codon:yes gene_type:complete